jgi:hypothetical protein
MLNVSVSSAGASFNSGDAYTTLLSHWVASATRAELGARFNQAQ